MRSTSHRCRENRKWFETDSNKDVREIDILEDPRQVNPLSAVQKRDLKDLITKGLSRAERLIVILYYYEEMTMKEIGVTLDLSESRVSQMHSSILARLKAHLPQHRSQDLESQGGWSNSPRKPALRKPGPRKFRQSFIGKFAAKPQSDLSGPLAVFVTRFQAPVRLTIPGLGRMMSDLNA